VASSIPELAGPREESLVEAARLLVSRRGDRLRIEEVSSSDVVDADLSEDGALLPGRTPRSPVRPSRNG
jgi:hypothetical protein